MSVFSVKPRTDSLGAFLESLGVRGPITTRPGRMLAGPPRWVMDAALFLFGGRAFDTPAVRRIFDNLGASPDEWVSVAPRLRSRRQWASAGLSAAAPHAARAEAAAGAGDRQQAIREYGAALALQGLAGGGDGFYFTAGMAARLQIARERRRLYGRLLEISGDCAERLTISHVHGQGPALLHFPAADRGLGGQRLPGMVVMHGLGGIKEDMDASTVALREAGYVTLAIDLPAHGEFAEGPRLGPQAEQAVIAALATLAARPEIDPSRTGVLGGSLGGFFALRAAAATRLPVACVALAAPFDVGTWLPYSVPALQATMAWVLGARSRAECYALARPLYLGDVLEKVACPVFIGQGTQDHVVHFTTAYEIARRLKAPVTVHPYMGVDHEVALPRAPAVSAPVVAWLKQTV